MVAQEWRAKWYDAKLYLSAHPDESRDLRTLAQNLRREIPTFAGMSEHKKLKLRRQLQFLAVKNPQHLRKIMTAFQDRAAHRDDQKRPLLARQFGALLNSVKRHFRRAAVNAEDGRLLKAIDRIVPPVAGGDKLTIEPKNAGKLGSGEGDRVGPAAGRRRGVLDSHKPSLARHARLGKT